MSKPTFADLMNDLAAVAVGFPSDASAGDLNALDEAMRSPLERLDHAALNATGLPGQAFAKAFLAAVQAVLIAETKELRVVARRTMLAGADAYVEHYRHMLRQGAG